MLLWFGALQHFTDASTLGRAIEAVDLAPEGVLGIPFADVMVFQSVEGKLTGAIFVLYNRFKWEIAADTLVVYFDDHDRVLHYGYSEAKYAFD